MADSSGKSLNKTPTAAQAGGFSRRRFLFLGGTAAAAHFLPVAVVSAAAQIAGAPAAESDSGFAPADFQRVSEFLTGKDIAPQLAARAWSALAQHDSRFSAQYQALQAFITASGARSIDGLKTQPGFSGAVRQTAADIISAYYLGYVGTPRPLRAHDDVIFITFTQAVMYRLTYDTVPLLTYSRWDTGFWSSAVNPV